MVSSSFSVSDLLQRRRNGNVAGFDEDDGKKPSSFQRRRPHGFAIFSKPLDETESESSSSDNEEFNSAELANLAVTRQKKRNVPPVVRTARSGDVVTVDLDLRGEGDFVPEPLFDSNGEISFVLDGGNYLPGLHDLIRGMQEGQTVSNASIDAGWGEHNPNLVATISKESLGEKAASLKEGSEMYLQSGHRCTVTAVTDDDFTVDCNPPLAGAAYSCNLKILRIDNGPDSVTNGEEELDADDERPQKQYQLATFGLGCFWGAELAFMREKGVVGTKVGYTQGHALNPTYDDVCNGETGHTEAVRIVYDPEVISYRRLVEVAMDRLGDSVYLIDQVGNDKGNQYRSGIYYHSDEQKAMGEKLLAKYGEHCQTELEPAADVFWPAEEYHQQYLLKGGQSAKKGATEYIRCYG